MSPPQELFNTTEAWNRFRTDSWNYLDGIPPKNSNLLAPSAPPSLSSKPSSPLSSELKYYIIPSSKESFTDEAWEKYTKFKEMYPDGGPPKNDSLSEEPNPHIAGNSRYTHKTQEDGYTINLTLLINWAPARASSSTSAIIFQLQARHIGELQLLIELEFRLGHAENPAHQRHLPDWERISMTRIAIEELAEKVSTSVATSAMTGMSGNLERFKTKTFLNNVVVELERRGTSQFKILEKIDMFWEKVGRAAREALRMRCQEYKETTELGEDEGDADDEDESDDEVDENSEVDEDSEDEDDKLSEDADEDYEPSRKRRSSDEDDDDIEPIRKRRKSDEYDKEDASSEDEGDRDSDEVIEAPRKRRTERPKGLQMEVFPDTNQTLCTQIYG